MSKEIILNCEKLERRFAMLNNGKLEEYKLERDDETPKAGDIYLGRIVNLDTSLQAAFVDIGAKKNAFLHFKEMLPGNSELVEQYRSESESKENAITSKRKKKAPLAGAFRWFIQPLLRASCRGCGDGGCRCQTSWARSAGRRQEPCLRGPR